MATDATLTIKFLDSNNVSIDELLLQRVRGTVNLLYENGVDSSGSGDGWDMWKLNVSGTSCVNESAIDYKDWCIQRTGDWSLGKIKPLSSDEKHGPVIRIKSTYASIECNYTTRQISGEGWYGNTSASCCSGDSVYPSGPSGAAGYFVTEWVTYSDGSTNYINMNGYNGSSAASNGNLPHKDMLDEVLTVMKNNDYSTWKFQIKPSNGQHFSETPFQFNVIGPSASSEETFYDYIDSNPPSIDVKYKWDFRDVSTWVPNTISDWTPNSISGDLQLWLDSSHLDSSGSFVDKSPNEMSITSYPTAPSATRAAVNASGIMEYTEVSSSSPIQYHKWSKISTIRTVFWVVDRYTERHSHLLCDDTSYDFHSGWEYIIKNDTWSSNNIRNGGTIRVNGESHTYSGGGQGPRYPSKLSIISLQTTGNVSASNFGNDRDIKNQAFIGGLAELLIFDEPLSSTNIERVEAYLANKWSNIIPDELPMDHPYGRRATVADSVSGVVATLHHSNNSLIIPPLGAPSNTGGAYIIASSSGVRLNNPDYDATNNTGGVYIDLGDISISGATTIELVSSFNTFTRAGSGSHVGWQNVFDFTTDDSSRIFLQQYSTGHDMEFRLHSGNNNNSVYSHRNHSNTTGTTGWLGKLSDSSYQHIIITVKGGTMKLFANGHSAGWWIFSTNMEPRAGSTNGVRTYNFIGAPHSTHENHFFDGRIKLFNIYSGAMTMNEIASAWDSGNILVDVVSQRETGLSLNAITNAGTSAAPVTSELSTLQSTLAVDSNGNAGRIRRKLSNTQETALGTIKSTSGTRDVVIKNLKLALNLMIASNDVDSIEVSADNLMLSEFNNIGPNDTVLVAKAGTTVTGTGTLFYSTLSNDGDYVWRQYNANDLGDSIISIKILREDVGNQERHKISISGASWDDVKPTAVTLRNGEEVSIPERFRDWVSIDIVGPSGNNSAGSASFLLPGDKVTFNAKSPYQYICIGSSEGGEIGNICFLGDTKVKTDQGIIAFNKLSTMHTISNRRIKKVVKIMNSDNSMIFIHKHALGKNVPNKNTYISRNHGIYIKGIIYRARNLVNGTTILEHKRKREYIYNVLLETYVSMYVNNMECESLNPDDPMVKNYIV